eukprot:SAG22_NODE_20_length_32168_cov_40.859241_12_plen_109_part_00
MALPRLVKGEWCTHESTHLHELVRIAGPFERHELDFPSRGGTAARPFRPCTRTRTERTRHDVRNGARTQSADTTPPPRAPAARKNLYPGSHASIAPALNAHKKLSPVP